MLTTRHLLPPRPAHASTRSGLAIGAAAALACTLFASPIYAAPEAKPSTPTPKREQLTLSPQEVMKPRSDAEREQIYNLAEEILAILVKAKFAGRTESRSFRRRRP